MLGEGLIVIDGDDGDDDGDDEDDGIIVMLCPCMPSSGHFPRYLCCVLWLKYSMLTTNRKAVQVILLHPAPSCATVLARSLNLKGTKYPISS